MVFTGLAFESYDLARLDSYLSSPDRVDGVMVLDQVDGFLTAVALTPRLVMPSEWLPEIWSGEAPLFACDEEAQAVYGALMGLYNDTLCALDALADENALFPPVFDFDADGNVMVDGWANGFLAGVGRFGTDWDPLLKDADLAACLALIGSLSFGEDEDSPRPADGLTKRERERLRRNGPMVIPVAVRHVREFWCRKGLAPEAPPPRAGPTTKSLWLIENGLDLEDVVPDLPARSSKVGRNEPCPCGSGKKYKRCCGAA